VCGTMNAGDPFEWYFEIPIVSRTYFTLAFLTTACCALEIVSPLTLYFNYKLIFEKGQVWRLVTNFMFFGMISLDFLFHLYFLVRYCRLLEENSFRGRTGDFVFFLLFGMVMMTVIAPFVNIPFFGSSLTFMMVYVWGRRNEHVRMSLLGLFPFTAPYLPWVLFTFSLVLGSSATVDLIGIAVGHIYFYLDDIYPDVARIRGWTPRQYLRLSTYFGQAEEIEVDTGGIVLGGAAEQVEEEERVVPETALPENPAQGENNNLRRRERHDNDDE